MDVKALALKVLERNKAATPPETARNTDATPETTKLHHDDDLISSPPLVRCADCGHFQRINHPNLGHCSAGQPEAIVGLWDTTYRPCDSYMETI